MKKKVIGISLVSVLLVVVIVSISINYKSKEKIIEIEELKESKSIAFYKAKDDGTYEETNTMPTSGYKLNEEKSVCSNGVKPKLEGTNSLRLTNMSKGSTNCYLYFDEIFGSAAKKVLGDITNVEEKTEFTGIATAADTGIYKAPDDYGTSYYFRGVENQLNNWVKFAGFYWRIIRVNGNGTIRMIYSGVANGGVSNSNKKSSTVLIGSYQYNNTWNDNAYVGYMMGIPLNGVSFTVNKTSNNSTSYEQAHTNTYDSDVKQAIDNWYKTNIEDKGLSKYVDVNTGFCNDREIASGYSNYTGGGYGIGKTVYKSADILFTTNLADYKTVVTPTLQCTNKDRDLFTNINANIGNKKLMYSASLITMDEIVYAGGFMPQENSIFYLYADQDYWTMSPFTTNETGNAALFRVYRNGELSATGVSGTNGVRPVLNLRADTVFTGEGSESNPFVVV